MQLNREQAAKDRDRAAYELAERTKLYKQRKAQYEALIAEYRIWLKQNLGRINTSMDNVIHNNNSELTVAGYEDALITAAENLANYSKDAALDAARYERDYQDKFRGNNTTATRATKSNS